MHGINLTNKNVRKFSGELYLNNGVFLSRNYRLIVTLRKFDVLKTNICPRSEASSANMLVLRLLQTFAGLHLPIFFFFVKKMKVRQLRYHFPKKCK